MKPSTAAGLAALGIASRARAAGQFELMPVPRQTAYTVDQLAAEIGGSLNGRVDGPASRGDRPGQGLLHGWDAVIDAVVREAGGQPSGLVGRSGNGPNGPAPKGGQPRETDQAPWAAVADSLIAEADASNQGGRL